MNSDEKHLCWDCSKALDFSCSVYEQITKIIDDNFEVKKIYFQIKECDEYIPEK